MFDSSKTKIENMIDNGYNYIWDCGNFVFVKDYMHSTCEVNSIEYGR